MSFSGLPFELWWKIISTLPREDIEKSIILVSRFLRDVAQDILAESIYYPSVDPHPQRYKYKRNTELYTIDLRNTINQRARVLHTLRTPDKATKIRKITITGQVIRSIWNDAKRRFQDSVYSQVRRSLQEREIQKLAGLLPNAINLQRLVVSSCSRAIADLIAPLGQLQTLEYCELPSANDLVYLSAARQPRQITINAACQCSRDDHGPHIEAPLDSLPDITQLTLNGTAPDPAELDLSRLSGLSILEINTDIYPLEKVVLEAKNLLHLSLTGLYNIHFFLNIPLFSNKLSFCKLEILTVRDCSICRIGDATLEFSGLRTLEISNVKRADLLFSQSFPAARNVLFSSTKEGQINKFLIDFVGRHSSQIYILLLQRRIETRYLLKGSPPCITTRHIEVLSKGAVEALLRCRLQAFSLEGRIYLEPNDLGLFWKSNRGLKQVYLAPPNALVSCEVVLQKALYATRPHGYAYFHGGRIVVRQHLGTGWCPDRVVDDVEERRQFLRAIDPTGLFTESRIPGYERSLSDILQLIEANRTDICLCDSVEPYTPLLGQSGNNQEESWIYVDFQGKRYKYEKWEPCPTLKRLSQKRIDS